MRTIILIFILLNLPLIAETNSVKIEDLQVIINNQREKIFKLKAELADNVAENSRLKKEIEKLKNELEKYKPKQKPSLPKPQILYGTETKKPLGFTNVSLGAFGVIHTATTEYVVNETEMVVSFVLDRKSGYLSTAYGQPLTKEALLINFPTQGYADNSGVPIKALCQITGTKKVGKSTYFTMEIIEPCKEENSESKASPKNYQHK